MPTHEQSSALLCEATIAGQSEISPLYREVILHCPAVAESVKPGQFVHLRIPDLRDRVLRRPFSVFKAEDGYLVILYKVVGAGTELLANAHTGRKVSVLGPLGNGFPRPDSEKTPVLVGGGYGAAPLFSVAKSISTRGVAFLGGATEEDLLCVSDFESLNWELRTATEDGSLGTRGLVTEILDEWLDGCDPSENIEIFSCGPQAMLRAVGERAIARGCKGWLSLDRPMGCGIGACLACVQRIRTEDGGWDYARICKDGPVFESREICWEEPEGGQ